MSFVKQSRRKSTVSDAMKAAAARLAEKEGIRCLQPGERRPDNFYVVSHFSGKPIIKDRNAVIPKDDT